MARKITDTINEYKGTFTIKWWKHDGGDKRPLCIQRKDRKELKEELARIRKCFMQEGDDPSYHLYHGPGLPHSISFDI